MVPSAQAYSNISPDNDSFCQYGLGNNALPSDYCYYICESPIYRHLLILHSKGFSLFDPETGKKQAYIQFISNGILPGVKHLFRTKWRNLYRRSKRHAFFFEEQLYHSNNNYHIYFDQLWVHNTRVLPDDETGILSQTLSQVKRNQAFTRPEQSNLRVLFLQLYVERRHHL